MIMLNIILILIRFYLTFLHIEAIIPRERFFTVQNQSTEATASVTGNDSTSGLRNITDNALTALLPTDWKEFCRAEFKFVSGSNFTGQEAVYVQCTLDHHHYWSLHDYRDWISANEERFYKYLPIESGLLFAFKLQCSFQEGKVSLPWPARAKYLWYVAVDDCTLLDHTLEFEVTHDTPDYLKVAELTNCNMETDTEQLFKTMLNFRNVSRDFDCGGEISEKLVLKNLRKTFASPDERDNIDIKHLPVVSKQSALDEMIAATLKGDFNDKHNNVNAMPNSVFKQPPAIPENDINNFNAMPKSSFPAPTEIPDESVSKPRIHNEQQMIESIARIGQDNQKIEHRCVYKHLRYLDQSRLHSRSKHHAHILVERSRYPALEFFNLSHSFITQMSPHMLDWQRFLSPPTFEHVGLNMVNLGFGAKLLSKHHAHILVERSRYPALEFFNLSHSFITQMSPHMLDWRRYFPNMRYLDLSHNRIKYFTTLSDNGLAGDPVGVLDLRGNNITTLTPDDLQTLSIHSRTVFVDIRDNPLNCDCKLSHFVHALKNTSNKVFKKYTYLQNMTCASPEIHAGKAIADLDADFCQVLEVLVLVVPIIVLCCCMVLLLAAFIVVVRYRREIMILAFTRLHLSLPCRNTLNIDKEYDAFIAYSERDCDWVFHTLLPRLEQPIRNNGPGFKLCIHHRDFPLGRCISDNILDKVKDSRHTVLILSNHFLHSQWCKYEFKTAFTQSIVEKKRHLIMVVKEQLDKRLIDHDLRRCLKTFTYVQTTDRLFWDKLIFALSDGGKVKPGHNVNNGVVGDRQNMQQNVRVVDANNGGLGDRENIQQNVRIVDADNNEMKGVGENNNLDGNGVNGVQGNVGVPMVWHIEEEDIHNEVDRQGGARRGGNNVGNGHENRAYLQDGVWDV